MFYSNKGKLYIAFNKPFAVLSQFTTQEGSNKTTLAQFGFPPGVYPVGRLDFDSEGLLLLSDDGNLNYALLHPIKMHSRTYLVQVENVPGPKTLLQLEKGVLIQGHFTAPAKTSFIDGEPDLSPRAQPIRYRKNIPTAWLKIILTEGKNHQVRRMTAAVGHPALRLVRVAIGKLNLFDLKLQPGMWVALTHKQLLMVFE